MLSALKFVRGAVSAKDYQPALTHFLIKEGRVMGFDGIIALSSPIDLDIVAAPKALPFIKAIERCEAPTTAINLTDTGKITLRSGKFRATIECTEEVEVLSYIQPEGDDVGTPDGLVESLSALAPFIGTDASRPWAMGILLRGYSAYATNNIILAQYWLGEAMPDINLPASAIKELVRIAEAPTRVQLSASSVTFHFESGRWLRSQLLSSEWPDIDGILEAAFDGDSLGPIPPGLFEGIETVAPFVEGEGRIYFRDDKVTTGLEGAPGASIEVAGIPERGAYNVKMINLLRDRATKIDFSKHPKPCPFVGKNMRGVFIGMVDL